ncbi:MAG: tagatose-bisphosphate aldolase [Candidatus Ryanbacteria bacterium RIFCSPLOWO2_01_FULL_48_26]|uniref:Tagatose-bisphosphate aldolase n=1 Tax=Candidatus Ryanbacteria bacterium RIFCSPLOWO2_01_FULL_48_26 TaxID=1802126 RepID=A0A1G2GTH2_9BACT|nr:MAG: tagatose-bisphosphate aldolase [Candidatus Ryanbacteria bacterium RIFCSPLOWO2_01_FULL_48_26]
MKTLRQVIQEAEKRKVAIGHFNISDLAALKAIFESARELSVPIIIGTSEGEREFIGVRQAAALVRSLREEYDYPIYLNADHTYSFEKVKEAIDAGYDAVIFDGTELSLNDNVAITKKCVAYARKVNPEIVVEAELGFIGKSSKVLDKIPEGVKLGEEFLTKPDEAAKFIQETEADMLAPAVGNIHGMLSGGHDPALNIKRIKEIREAAGVPLVLHGGSGNSPDDFVEAIKAGVRIVHINTEIRVAWRRGLENALKNNPKEVAPYKILPFAAEEIKKVVMEKLKLFSGI